jgi:hypothetical protein
MLSICNRDLHRIGQSLCEVFVLAGFSGQLKIQSGVPEPINGFPELQAELFFA